MMNKFKKLKFVIFVKMQRKFELVEKKNEVYLVELEFGKGSLMCVGVENIFVYGDFGVRVYFDYVFLVELGYYYFCGGVVFIVFLIV